MELVKVASLCHPGEPEGPVCASHKGKPLAESSMTENMSPSVQIPGLMLTGLQLWTSYMGFHISISSPTKALKPRLLGYLGK